MNNIERANAVETIQDARKAAEAFLAKEVPFIGGFAAAKKAGYVKGTAQFDLYALSYVASLPESIAVDENKFYAGAAK